MTSPEEWILLGYWPITVPYREEEMPMAHRVMDDLAAGGIPAALVSVPGGVEVWRIKDGMRFRRTIETIPLVR